MKFLPYIVTVFLFVLFQFNGFSQISIPYSEGFESGFGSWVNVGGDDFDWSINSGTTPSTNTGPSAAHEGINYIYGEASNPNYPANECYLEATFDFTGAPNPVFEFYYHMFGSTINTLHIDVNDGAWNTDVWSLSGEQQTATTDPFTLASVDLSAFGNQNNITIRLRITTGTGGTGWQSDIAVDKIFVYDNCGVNPGTASISDNALCGTTSVDVSLSGQGAGSIQWQQSTNGGAYTDVSGATAANSTISGLSAGNFYEYRAKVTNGCSSYSDTISVYVASGSGSNSVPYSESFETGIGSWTQSAGDDIDWTRQTGATPSNNTGPTGASDGSFYMFTEASGGNANSTAIFENDFDLSGTLTPQIEFDYHMFGTDMGTLALVVNGNTEWTLSGQQQSADTDPWTTATVDLSSYSDACNVLIQLIGYTGNGFRSDISIDNILVTDPCAVVGGNASVSDISLCADGTVDLSLSGQGAGSIQWQQAINGGAFMNISGATSANYTTSTLTSGNTYEFRAVVTNLCSSYSDTVSTIVGVAGGTISIPYTESFEAGIGFWTQNGADDIDWTNQTGGTTSNNTGPAAASDGNYYMYTEASNPNFNSTAILEGDFDFTGTVNPQLEFDYHMFGADMGTLSVIVNGNTEWTISGEQQTADTDAWITQTIDLSAYANKCIVFIEFVGETGANFRSDIAIDKIALTDPCAVIPGSASVSDASLCANGTVDLSLTGHDTPSTIQWQQSINGGVYADIAGATSANVTTGTLTTGNTYQFRAVVTNGCNSYSDTVTTVVSASGGSISTFPYTEGFETGIGSWTQNVTDDIDWTNQTGATPSNNTGPLTASVGNFYMFTEASNPNFNSTAILELDFDFTGLGNPQLTFDYHMFGLDMGTLSVIVNGVTEWSISGQQQAADSDPWITQTIDLTDYANSCYVLVQFSGRTGANFRSDMAIDNINLYNSDLVWTGNTSSDWNTASNWSPSFVPNPYSNVLIPDVSGASGNFPDVNGVTATASNVTVDANADIEIFTGDVLEIYGDLLNNGSPVFGPGEISMNGSSQQLIDGSIDLTNLTIDNSGAGVNLNSGTFTISGILRLTSGNFDTGNSLTLVSDAFGTAMIAEITGGSITGDVIAQRYIDAGATNWRFMSSPIQNMTLQDWNDDLITTGFPGSDWPNWPSASNPWVNIYNYTENQGTSFQDGFTAVTNITQSIGLAEGFSFWSGDTITGTQPFLVDLQGTPITGDVDFGVTYTASAGGALNDGYNLVGNPYAAPIDWDSPNWTKTNINGAIYIWNPDLQQYAVYVPGATPGTGIGTNGGSRYIASHQAFFVQATSGPSLIAHENVKAEVTEAFIKQGTPVSLDVFGLKVVAPNGKQDEVLMRIHDNATQAFNPILDAHKVIGSNASVPNMSIEWNENSYTVKSFQAFNSEIEIPIKVDVNFDGNYQLSFVNNSIFSDMACVVLEDLYNDTLIDLRTVSSYQVYLYDTTELAQFVIHFSSTVRVETTDATCLSDGSAEVFLDGFNDNFSYGLTWTDVFGNVLGQNSSIQESYSISNLMPGEYLINAVDSTGVCGTMQTSFNIYPPDFVEAEFTISEDTIDILGDNYLFLENTSINAEYYEWSFGDGNNSSSYEPIYSYTSHGDYPITLIAWNEDDCYDTIVKQVSIIDASMLLEEELVDDMNVYFNGESYILDFNLNEPRDLELKVYNELGQILHNQSFVQTKDQEHSLLLDYDNSMFVFVLSDPNGWTKVFKVPNQR